MCVCFFVQRITVHSGCCGASFSSCLFECCGIPTVSPHLHPAAPTLHFAVGRLKQKYSSAKTLVSREPGWPLCHSSCTHACRVPPALMQPTYCSQLIAAAMIAMINVFILSHLLSVSERTDNYLLLIPNSLLGWKIFRTKSQTFQRREKAKC